MEAGTVAIIAIAAIVIIFNFYFIFSRTRRSTKRKGGRDYVPPDEAKQAIWRDKEIARRIEREQNDAYERVKMRNETLAYYDAVRQMHANDDDEPAEGAKSTQEVSKA